MAIDIRATVTCSLGTLISASLSDEYVQDTGLIKCTGTCELSGVYTPNIGTAVTFSYSQGGVTRQVPRKLRVLSSFADPFRRTTSVSLGCKLKYLENLQEPVDWTAFDDEDNAGLTTDDAEIITIPIRAKSVMKKCLQELGITASSNPLTNKFSVEKFDLSGGYVSVLSDLLVSESYCGYLDKDEVLQVFSLDQKGGTGPVVDSTKLIDLGPINVGDLPGEAVTVSYDTLKLKEGVADPDAADWDTVTSTNQHTIVIPYTTTAGPQYKTYKLIDKDLVSTTWEQIIKPNGEVVRKPKSRRSIETRGSVTVVGSLVTSYLSNGMSYANVDVVKDTSEFFYYDEWGNETLYISDTLGSMAHLAGALGLPTWVFTPNSDYVQLSTTTDRSIEYVVKRTYTVGNFQRVITETYGPWTNTIPGQQAMASGVQDLSSASQVNTLLSTLFPSNGGLGNRGLFLIDTTVSTERVTEGQIAPDGSSVINAENASGGDPSNGYKTESKAELELALGSATAQRRVEFQMPWAPDDVFTRSGTAPNYTYSSTPSDADEKAKRYGRSQNRLRLGNRSGMNIQMAAPLMPSAPFAPFIVQANGLSALYRTNGTSWQMDANGILASTDALFWSAVGGTGAFWFPVSPTVTTLPTTPPVVNGEMTVTTTVPVWNETVVLAARTSTKLVVTSLPYPLTLLTEAAVATKTKLVSRAIKPLSVPAAVSFTLLPRAVRVVTGASVKPPVAAISLAAAAPTIAAGKTVAPAVIDLALEANAPAYVGKEATVVQLPASTLSVAGVAPTINTAIEPPVATIGVTAFLPLIWREPIEFVGAGTAGSSTASFGSLAWPTHKANDIGLWVIETEGGSTDITPPTGWAAVPGSPVQDTGATGGSKLHLWWRRAASNAEPTVTVPDSGDHQVARIHAFRGCVSVGDPWDVTTTGSKVVASTTATVPAVTTTTFNTQVVMVIGRPNDLASTTDFSNPVNSGLVGLVEHGEAGSTQGLGGGFVVLSGRKELPGSTGTTTVTKSSSTTDTYIVLALKS